MKAIRAAVAAVLSLALGGFGLAATAPRASAIDPTNQVWAVTSPGPGWTAIDTRQVLDSAEIPAVAYAAPVAHVDAILAKDAVPAVAAIPAVIGVEAVIGHPAVPAVAAVAYVAAIEGHAAVPAVLEWQYMTPDPNGWGWLPDLAWKTTEFGYGRVNQIGVGVDPAHPGARIKTPAIPAVAAVVGVAAVEGHAAIPAVAEVIGVEAKDAVVGSPFIPAVLGVPEILAVEEVLAKGAIPAVYHTERLWSPPAPIEVKAASMNLTYMTACAPDGTNTWRIRNGSTFVVPFTLEYVGQPMLIGPPSGAPVGDSFLETPRQDATAILRWGGGDSGIIAGSVTKASGKDEVSDKCAGDKTPDKVVTVDVGSPDCGATVIKTETTTTAYIREGNEWILDVGHAVTTEGTRALTSEEMVLFQNTNSKGLCYVKPMIKDATTVVTTAKWVCNDKTAVTSSVTTAYSFAFDSKTGTYGPALAKAGTPVVGVRDLTATEFVACPVLAVVPVSPFITAPVVTQDVLASTGANDVTPWGVGAGLLALLTGAGLLIARKKA